MKTMIVSDFITMKNAMVQLASINLVCAVFIGAVSQSALVATGALAIMVPFMYVFSISAYDEMNGWERFRLTLPIDRRQVVLGRYAGIALLTVACGIAALALLAVFEFVAGMLPAGTLPEELLIGPAEALMPVSAVALIAAIVLAVAAFTLPLIMKFGMTKGTRIVPIVMVLLVAGGIYLCGDAGVFDAAEQVLLPMLGGVLADPALASMLLGGGLLVVSLALFAASAALSVKLYEGRQF